MGFANCQTHTWRIDGGKGEGGEREAGRRGCGGGGEEGGEGGGEGGVLDTGRLCLDNGGTTKAAATGHDNINNIFILIIIAVTVLLGSCKLGNHYPRLVMRCPTNSNR